MDLDLAQFLRDVTFSWVDKGCLLPTRDQGKTNGCTFFAVVDLLYASQRLDGAVARKGSEQHLLDLLHRTLPTPVPVPNSASTPLAGVPNSFVHVFEFLQREGLLLEDDSPFEGICNWDFTDYRHYFQVMRRLFIRSYRSILPPVMPEIERVIRIQPIAATMIVFPSLQFYHWQTSLPYHPTEDELRFVARNRTTFHTHPNVGFHAIVLIGYGVTLPPLPPRIPFLVAKNSWGDSFGCHGLFKVCYNQCYNYLAVEGVSTKVTGSNFFKSQP